MRFTKPAWVAHQEAGDKKRSSIFSIHVHPDGSRIATGGLDAKIKIWATLPILQQEFDDSVPGVDGLQAPPKKLCTLSQHAGPVLCVRWSYSGKWLASGSDDTIIMIWDLDPNGGGRVWGSEDINVEGWKALKRLPGHDSDVTDLAFSPGDRYLASVGLDSKVLIWNGANLELLRKLDQHQGFVKGVCWDPVGQFLATGSDDKSVNIWNSSDWTLETTITQPFEKSPGSTFFRRLSWSPDGAHITASNAMNNNGLVFVAAVISRSTWSSNISLVGHENTIEVAAYNPHIFRRDMAKPVHTQNICSVVALGSDDLSISVWQTKSARPLIVAKDVFERPVMDLTWAQDGLTLYACSSDGFIGVLDFDENELEGIAPLEVQADYLKLFNFTPPPIVEPYLPRRQVPQPYQGHYNPSPQHQYIAPGYPNGPSQEPGPPETIYINGKKKKRIQPVFVSHLSSSGVPGPPLPTLSNVSNSNYPTSHPPAQPSQYPPHSSTLPPLRQDINQPLPSRYPDPHSSGPPHALHPHHHHLQPPVFPQGAGGYHDNYGRSTGEPRGYVNGDGSGHLYNNRVMRERDTSMGPPDWEADVLPDGGQLTSLEDAGSSVVKREREPRGRTLGGDRPRRDPSIPIREIRTIAVSVPSAASMDIDGDGNAKGFKTAVRLPIPPLRTSVSAKIEDRESDVFEGKNSEDGTIPPEVCLTVGKNVEFIDFVSSNVIAVAASSLFCAAALEDGSVNVYSHSGRRIVGASSCGLGACQRLVILYRLMPSLVLDSVCIEMDACRSYLMAITSAARVYVWDIKMQCAHFSCTAVQPLLSSPNLSILSATVRSSGAPVILLSDGIAYSYDVSLCSWIRLSEARWSLGSQVWEGKQRSSANRALGGPKGVVASLENAISELDLQDLPALQPPPENLPWWTEAMTLAHLETRMHAARLLDSPSEYKSNLILYAKRISEEGLRTKGEELLKELCGPLYWKPSREETWNPVILGMQKRDLLKDVVGIFVRSRTLAKLGQNWQEILKKVQTDM